MENSNGRKIHVNYCKTNSYEKAKFQKEQRIMVQISMVRPLSGLFHFQGVYSNLSHKTNILFMVIRNEVRNLPQYSGDLALRRDAARDNLEGILFRPVRYKIPNKIIFAEWNYLLNH